MQTFEIILGAVIPVYLLVALGFTLRRREIVSGATESTLFKLLINLWVPCLVITVVARNPAFDNPKNILWPPLMGFVCVAAGIGLSWAVSLILSKKTPAKTRLAFAYTTGVFNYGYIPIPLITMIFDTSTLGVLFVFNVGVEVGLWLFGLPMMAGSASISQIFKRILNPPLITLCFSVVIRLFDLGEAIPLPFWNLIVMLSGCAIPVGILLVGMAMADHLTKAVDFRKPGLWTISCVLRNGVLAGLFLLLARHGSFTKELTVVIAIQGAMPTAVFPVVLAKHFGGDARTATQIILATSALAFITAPLWLDFSFKILQLR